MAVGLRSEAQDGTNGAVLNGNGSNGSTHNRNGQTSGSLDLTVLGINSGTCMDGIDLALVHYTQQTPTNPLHMEVLAVSSKFPLCWHPDTKANLMMQYDELPVPQWIKKPVLKMLRETETTPSAIGQLNIQLGTMFSDAVEEFCTKHAVNRSSIDLIGSHGQTIWLLTCPKKGEIRCASCLGDATIIAANTGITTVTDFRQAEQAVGRQGAPLVALIDGLLLRHPTKLRVCQNIGGIANLCFIPPDSEGGVDAMIDWDCGPGNMFIDAAMRYVSSQNQSTTTPPQKEAPPY